MDCSSSGSSVSGIPQARILEWVASSFSRGSLRPRDWNRVACIAGGFFTIWANRQVHYLDASPQTLLYPYRTSDGSWLDQVLSSLWVLSHAHSSVFIPGKFSDILQDSDQLWPINPQGHLQVLSGRVIFSTFYGSQFFVSITEIALATCQCNTLVIHLKPATWVQDRCFFAWRVFKIPCDWCRYMWPSFLLWILLFSPTFMYLFIRYGYHWWIKETHDLSPWGPSPNLLSISHMIQQQKWYSIVAFGSLYYQNNVFPIHFSKCETIILNLIFPFTYMLLLKF